jgi:hypothetical protein
MYFLSFLIPRLGTSTTFSENKRGGKEKKNMWNEKGEKKVIYGNGA